MNTFTHGWGMGFGWLVPLLIIGLLFYFLQDKNKTKEKSSAQDILDKRYASGGIDKKEYDDKSKHLKEQELKR
ncbi:MAG: electron transporter RnfE [Sulfurovum sp.]|nr:MAG: electron transporter RnfE [Sulfurovum sp.]